VMPGDRPRHVRRRGGGTAISPMPPTPAVCRAHPRDPTGDAFAGYGGTTDPVTDVILLRGADTDGASYLRARARHRVGASTATPERTPRRSSAS
jgi:hypothetical protein